MYNVEQMTVAPSSELSLEEILEASQVWIRATSCQVFVGISKDHSNPPMFIHTFPLESNIGVLYSNLGGDKIGVAGFNTHQKLFNLHNWIIKQIQTDYPQTLFWEGKMNNYVCS